MKLIIDQTTFGEKLNDKSILVVDGTEYINGSIDLSNAKSNSPTVGFAIFPIEYSGIRIRDIYDLPQYADLKENIDAYYQYNRELDTTLGYIGKKGYKTEQILNENELFARGKEELTSKQEIEEYLEKTIEFFRTVKIPNNMDGYEIYAFYKKFINELPLNISSNVIQKTLYINAYDYRIDKIKKKFLHVPAEYLQYLQELVYNRYYKYLTEAEYNAFLEQVKSGYVDLKSISDSIAACEMRIADINRKLNLFHTINKLSIFDPYMGEERSIQLYEPMMGSVNFDNIEDYDSFEKKIIK